MNNWDSIGLILQGKWSGLRPPGHMRRLLKESLGSSQAPQSVPHVPGFSAMIGVASLTLAFATCFTLLHNLQRISFQNFRQIRQMSLHGLRALGVRLLHQEKRSPCRTGLKARSMRLRMAQASVRRHGSSWQILPHISCAWIAGAFFGSLVADALCLGFLVCARERWLSRQLLRIQYLVSI